MKIINLTPHEINLLVRDEEIAIPPSGTIARCEEERETTDFLVVDGVKIPINEKKYGAVYNLPSPQEGVVYIVSLPVAQAVAQNAPHRTDVFIVDDTVRDDKGRIVGARALARIPR